MSVYWICFGEFVYVNWFNGIIHPKMTIQALFGHTYVIRNVFSNCLSSAKHKTRYFEECPSLTPSVWTQDIFRNIFFCVP